MPFFLSLFIVLIGHGIPKRRSSTVDWQNMMKSTGRGITVTMGLGSDEPLVLFYAQAPPLKFLPSLKYDSAREQRLGLLVPGDWHFVPVLQVTKGKQYNWAVHVPEMTIRQNAFLRKGASCSLVTGGLQVQSNTWSNRLGQLQKSGRVAILRPAPFSILYGVVWGKCSSRMSSSGVKLEVQHFTSGFFKSPAFWYLVRQ